jgi:hypothetical protein
MRNAFERQTFQFSPPVKNTISGTLANGDDMQLNHRFKTCVGRRLAELRSRSWSIGCFHSLSAFDRSARLGEIGRGRLRAPAEVEHKNAVDVVVSPLGRFGLSGTIMSSVEREQKTRSYRGNDDDENKTPIVSGWISEDLLRETQAVWSREYGRNVDPAEATAILLNVKRLAKLLVALNSGAR